MNPFPPPPASSPISLPKREEEVCASAVYSHQSMQTEIDSRTCVSRWGRLEETNNTHVVPLFKLENEITLPQDTLCLSLRKLSY